MSGNGNSGRKPRYLTISVFNKFLNNDFFHMKVELRVQSFVVGIILIIVASVAVKVWGG